MVKSFLRNKRRLWFFRGYSTLFYFFFFFESSLQMYPRYHTNHFSQPYSFLVWKIRVENTWKFLLGLSLYFFRISSF